MTEVDMTPLDVDRLAEAADKVQKFVISVSPNPGDGLGIAAMLMTNYLASGLAIGIFEEEFIDVIMQSIRESVVDTFAAIREGIAADAASETIQ